MPETPANLPQVKTAMHAAWTAGDFGVIVPPPRACSRRCCGATTKPCANASPGGFRDVRTRLVPIDVDLPVPPVDVVATFRRYFGPTVVAFNRLDEAGQHALEADLLTLWSDANTASNPAAHTLVANEYLLVTATRV